MKPLIVLDGSETGIFANHRHNLDAYISEARQKMYSIREELDASCDVIAGSPDSPNHRTWLSSIRPPRAISRIIAGSHRSRHPGQFGAKHDTSTKSPTA